MTISTTDAPAAELLEEEITIKNPQTNQETKKKLKWASCEVVMSKNSGVVTAVDTESQSDSWTEDVLTELSPIETLQAERQEVDCLDGASSTSRENQLGNARGTANDDPKIPHGLNANRYIWTVPNTPDKNCVLRLRYNIR